MSALTQSTAYATDSTQQPASTHILPTRTTTSRIVAARILTSLTTLFLLFDGIMKLVKPAVVVQATLQLGYPEKTIVGMGLVLLFSTVVYLIPRTAIFGAILLTGYLGGAVATNVRVSAPLFNIVFPALFAILLWAGLYLRDKRLQQIFAA